MPWFSESEMNWVLQEADGDACWAARQGLTLAFSLTLTYRYPTSQVELIKWTSVRPCCEVNIRLSGCQLFT